MDYLDDKCIYQLFEAQVERTPNTIALICENKQLTYQELNCRANQLAHYLRSQGVGPETLVGICIERSLEMVIGILGILKAGGAYLPLDPAYPKERLAFMLKDGDLSFLLTQEHLLDKFSEHKTQIILLDSSWKRFAQESTENLLLTVTSKNLIAVFYTSGSTGQPKGTMINGIGFLNLCLWYKKYGKFTEKSRLLLLTPFTFDASFKNILTPLLTGSQTILVDLFNVFAMLKAIESYKITTINTTPSLFNTILKLAATKNYQPLKSLEFVFLGGEDLVLTNHIKCWLNSSFCHCELSNFYGPTECSDISVVYKVPKDEINIFKKIPIGQPIDNFSVHILNNNNQLQPIGEVGELCLSGEGLARGYLNRPDLTAEKFISNSWNSREKIYKTGDLARWLPDGNLEFLGRIDHQVKLRGIRIEIGEIEIVLKQHPDVQEAVVITMEDLLGDKCLVAYVILDDYEHTTTFNNLRSFLKTKLADHMIPTIFVKLKTLPLTSNGKINRQALPVPDQIKQG